MSALDWINGKRSHEQRKHRHPDSSWQLLSSFPTGSFQLELDGSVMSGSVNMERSRYLRVGHDLCFFAYVSGSEGAPPAYHVVREEKRVGYVAPKDYGWGVPAATEDDDGE